MTGQGQPAAAVLVGILALWAVSLAPASASGVQGEGADTIAPSLGERILVLLEAEADGRWDEAAAGYSRLLERRALSAFERATLLKLRGRAWYETGQPGRTVEDWQAAIALQSLPAEDENTLRINSGQLLFGAGEYRAGIGLIEAALAQGVALNSDLAMRLAQAHAQLGEHRDGLAYARTAFDMAQPPERPHFTLLLHFYQELDRVPDQLALMEAMIERWPDEAAIWAGYASLLAHSGRPREAFEVNRIMYVNGMLERSEDLVRLARYYSYYAYPYRGAVLLERELNGGRVDPEPGHFRLLAGLWREAREWDRALPVLRRVATLTGSGTDYEALGEALYRSGDFAEAEVVFLQALHRGGVARPGDTWTLVGNTRVEEGNLLAAMDAFEVALQWEYSRATAQGWIDFIERKLAILADTRRLEEMTAIERCANIVEHQRRSVAVRDEQFDSEGRRIFSLAADCSAYFDAYGNLRREYQRS